MGAILSWFTGVAVPPKKGEPGFRERVSFEKRFRSFITVHFRGFIGSFGPPLLFSWFGNTIFDKQNSLTLIWLTIFWVFAWMPVNVATGGMMVIFLIPMCGIMPTVNVCRCVLNDNIFLLLLGNMVGMIFNQCGIDRRLALMILNNSASPRSVLVKAGLASFILAALCNKLITTELLIVMVGTAVQKFTDAQEPNSVKFAHVVFNAIQTSACFGSMIFIHTSMPNIAMRSIVSQILPNITHAPDMFNYMQWFAVTSPLAIVLFIINVVLHLIILSKVCNSSQMSAVVTDFKSYINGQRETLKGLNLHDYYCLVFYVVGMALLFTRYCPWLNSGWSTFSMNDKGYPSVSDATIFSLWGLILHALPRSIHFIRTFGKSKMTESDLKPELGILNFKYIDKNANYAAFWIIATGNALVRACVETGLASTIATNSGRMISKYNRHIVPLFISFISIIICNAITPLAATSIIMPFFLSMMYFGNESDFNEVAYTAPITVAACATCSFMFPYLYSPAHISHHIGQVPIKRIALYSLPMMIISGICIYICMAFYAPFIYAGDKVILGGTPPPPSPE